jgi:hypothetical protein
MNDDAKVYWFPAKRHGWGWGWPTRWQGQLVMALFVVAEVAVSLALPPAQFPRAFWGATAAYLAALVLVCWLKGAPPGWRWGSDRR